MKKLRWWIIALVCMGTITNYLSRNTLSVASASLMDQLNFDKEHYSYIISAFQLAYTIGQPIAGYLLDIIGLRIGFFIFIFSWSIIEMSHAFASGYLGLVFLRGFMGLTEASAIPAGIKAASEWFPKKERGIAAGIFNMGTSVGAMLAPPLVGFILIAFASKGTGVQMAFLITGGIGVIFSFAWLHFYHSPSKHPKITKEEFDYIKSGQEAHLAAATEVEEEESSEVKNLNFIARAIARAKSRSKTKARLKGKDLSRIIKSRNFIALASTRFLADPAWSTLSFWMPLYLMQELHLPIKELALFAWLPFLTADIGCVAGGFLAKLFMERFNMTTIDARRAAFSVGASFMLAMGFVSITTNPYWAIVLLSIGGFAHQTLSTVVITMSADLFKQDEVATVAGMTGAAAWTGALTFNLFLGALVKIIGYGPFFIALSLFDIIGAAILWIVIKDPEKINRQANKQVEMGK